MKRKAPAVVALAGVLVGCLPLAFPWWHLLDLGCRLVSLLLNLPGFIVIALFSVEWWHTVPGHVVAGLLTWGFYAWLWNRRRDLVAAPTPAPGLTRRQFLSGTAMGGLTLLCYGFGVERLALQPTVRRLPIRGLPPELEGLRLGFMSDLHCGPVNSQDYLMGAVRAMNDLKPDVIVLPGDFVSVSGEYFPRAAELLSELRPRITGALLGTLGNHDHWHGLELARAQLPAAGLHIVENRHLILTPRRELSSGGRGLCLAGVGDLWEDKPDLHLALAGVPEDVPRLVMCHNPDVAEWQAEGAPRVDLMLSGHTHGGQVSFPVIGPPLLPSDFGQKYAEGLVQAPSFPVFVTRGVGVGGIPVRLGVRPEIVLFELTQA